MQMEITLKGMQQLGADILALKERALQESEGRIPPLTQTQAFKAYGRKRVKAWMEEKRVKAVRKGKKGILFRHSELEYALAIDNRMLDEIGNQITRI